MQVAGLQLDVVWQSPPDNFRRAYDLACEAAAGGARLLVLPEMFATGFTMESAEAAVHAPAVREFLANLATELDVWVLGGYAEPGTTLPANVCGLYDRSGREILHYRKIHPFSLAAEHEHYEAGDQLVTADVEGLRMTPLICYDLRFPELVRAAAADTDLFAVPANWPERRSAAWRTLLQARAIDGQAWVLGVNRVGASPGGYRHRGDTSLVDPTGTVVKTRVDEEGVVDGMVDPETVIAVRKRHGFLADRRPDLYEFLNRRHRDG